MSAMAHTEILYTDDFGEVTEEQWQLYRERNVSPSDHSDLEAVYGAGEAGRDRILDAVREFSRHGQYSGFQMVRAAQRRDQP